ncbi:MAG: alkaline phosphatase family protein [Clostridia bacterium]|nr:alkaline phosphatase family protein [Clostridia bacterium]
MSDYINSVSLTSLAATLADAIGIERPEKANPPIGALAALAGKVDRIFMYNPDAVALWLYQKYTVLFDDVVKHTSLALPLCSVMPSVTPVCFGTMYTGAYPEVHGIRKYAKPVIKIDTIFDAIIRAGKKCAIVCDNECSMGKIFLERDMDYFYFDDVDAINAKAMELINEDKYDLICVYNGNYDSTMHKNGTEAPVSIEALKHNVAAFDMFATAIKENWTGHDTLIGFAMDHGCHDIDGGSGSHGLDMPEDLNIMHFYGKVCKKA